MGIIQRQGLNNAIITFIGLLIGFASLLYVQPRFLSPEEIGLTRVLFSLSSLIGVFLPLGIGTITVKYFPMFRDKESGHNGFMGFVFGYMFTGAVVMFVALTFAKPFFISAYQEKSKLFTDYYNLVWPFSFIIGFNAVLTLYCNSIFKSTFPALVNEVLLRIVSIILFTVYFCKFISLQAFIYLFVGIYFAQGTSLLIYLILSDKVSIKANTSLIKEIGFKSMAVYGIWMSFVSVASMGIKYIDSIVLGKYSLYFVGIYTIAAFIPNVIEAPLLALERIAGTKIAHAIVHGDIEEVKKIYYQSAKYLLILGGLIFVGIVVNIKFLLLLLPPEYMGGLEVVYIISLGSLFTILGGNNTQIIFSSENYIRGGLLLIGVAISAFILNLLLIPRYGMNGAAVAMAISTFLYSLSKFIIIYRQFKLQPYNYHTVIIILLILVSVVLGIFIPAFTNPILTIAFKSVIVSAIYVTVVVLLRIVPEANQKLYQMGIVPAFLK